MINDHPETSLLAYSLDYLPVLEVVFEQRPNKKAIENAQINIAEFIAVKSYRDKGKRISNNVVKKFSLLDPLPYDEEALPEPEDEVTENVATEDKEFQTELPEADKKDHMSLDF